MSNISIIPSITCKVECGTERGTAFFVDAHRLLTAFHVVGSALNGNLIYVEIEGVDYECELIKVKDGKDIAILKLKDDTVSHEYGSLLSMPIEAKTHFRFWGYPNTLIGEAIGQSVKIRVDETYVGLPGEFDAYAVFEDEKHLTEYTGFSGSPVYADSDKIIGVVTDILDSHIGFISIKSVEYELKTQGVFAEFNYIQFQEIAYGRKECIEKLRRQIILAGNRYKPELDVPNQSFKALFTNLWDIRDLEKHKEILHKSKQLFLSLRESRPELFDTTVDMTLSDLDYNIRMLRDVEYLKIYDASHRKTIEGALKEESLSWKQIQDSIEYVVNRREKVYCIYGPAGCGKTHNVCSIASQLIKETNVYLCFGIQFNKNKDGIIAEIRKIFNFENENYLEELQKKAENDAVNISARRYVFIIDALNEGLDDSYWCESLEILKKAFDKYSNLALVVTVREPFHEKYGLNRWSYEMQRLSGLEKSQEVVNKYFDFYHIDYDKKLSGFKNGLFLNIFCETYTSIPYHDRKWLRSLWGLYRQYIYMRERSIAEAVDEDPEQNITWHYLCRLAHLSVFTYKFHPITRKKARVVSNQLCGYRTWSKSLLYNLIVQGLLLADWNNQGNNSMNEEAVVKFEYEQMEDVIRAIAFLNTKSDKQTKIIQLKEFIKSYERETLCEEGFYQFLTYLTILWPEKFDKKEIVEENMVRNNAILQQCFIEGLEWHLHPVKENVLDDFLQEAEKTLGYRFIFRVSLHSLNGFFKTLHQSLNALSQADLDFKWTHIVNQYYEESVLYSEDVNEQEYKTEAYLLAWSCASSHPVIRAYAKRKLCHILCNHSDLFDVLILDFHSAKDTYVLEGLYNAIYGALLLMRDVVLCNNVSFLIYEHHFKSKQPVEDVRVREWLLKILLFTKTLKDGIDLFSKSLPPYIPQEKIVHEKIEIGDEYFGRTEGSRKLRYSLCGSSDFNRYILGFNTKNESRVYSIITHGQNEITSMLPLIQLQSMVAQKINSLGWNDKLGELDNGVYSSGRYENLHERIGKKYQWKALFAVEAQLMDNFSVIDRWYYGNGKKRILNPPYPWYSYTKKDFDVTMTRGVIDDAEIAEVRDKQSPFVIDKQMTDTDWINQAVTIADCQHFFVGDDNRWVLLFNIFSEFPIDGEFKDAYLSYETFFVRNEDAQKFEKWIVKQNFIGRVMPDSGQNTDICLLEYPWMLPYLSIEQEDWIYVSAGDGKCPCHVMLTNYTQFQHDTMGLGDEYKEINMLPCPELMNTMGLHFKGRACFTYGKDDLLVSFYASTVHYRAGIPKGLHIRRTVLDEFLRTKGYTLYWTISAERQLIFGAAVPNYKTYSFCAKYGEGGEVNWVKDR